MLSILPSQSLNYETDEMQSSSSSSSPSFDTHESFLYNYYGHYQDTSLNNIMNEQHQQHQHQHQQQHQADLTFQNPDWSMNKSPQHSFISNRDELYSPMDERAVAPSYSTYNSYENFSNDMTDSIHHNETVYQPTPTMTWPRPQDHQMVNMMEVASAPAAKLTSQFSNDFFIHNNKKPQLSHGHHLMNIFPLPPPPPPPPAQPQHHHQTTSMFGQRPNHGSPYLNKGDKYHPRFKSANARLSPFTEHQDMYQLFSSSSSASPPQHAHLIKQEEMTIAEGENSMNNLTNSIDQQQPPPPYYQTYQDEKEFTQITTEQT
ncbi:hypothetical protein BD770DRAFT_386873 [Pilaira anomala]|nr:hypothetical protein BD770DRAFT_386873 [Pilaira anomala]